MYRHPRACMLVMAGHQLLYEASNLVQMIQQYDVSYSQSILSAEEPWR